VVIMAKPCLEGALVIGNCADGVLVIGLRMTSDPSADDDDNARCFDSPRSNDIDDEDLFVGRPEPRSRSLVESGKFENEIIKFWSIARAVVVV